MSDFTIYVGMTRPTLALTLTRSGVAVDVSAVGIAVKLYVRNIATGSQIIDGHTMTKDVPASGQVSYAFTALETATVGSYLGQAEITYADLSKERTDTFSIGILDAV